MSEDCEHKNTEWISEESEPGVDVEVCSDCGLKIYKPR